MSDNISFKILESIPVIHGRINAAIAEEANRIVKQGQDQIKRKIKQSAGEWVGSQPEMIALSNNSLAAELGLRFGTGFTVVLLVFCLGLVRVWPCYCLGFAVG